MFFSLDRPVTKHQLLNTKVFLLSFQFEKESTLPTAEILSGHGSQWFYI